MVITTKILPPFVGAMTILKLILIHPDIQGADREAVLRHERAHVEQQWRWFCYGLGVGWLVWIALYLLVLPVGWNYWRKKWETEAMLAQGRLHWSINETLKRAPYFLWWM